MRSDSPDSNEERQLQSAVGNLTQRQNLGLGLTEGFSYDNLHRLTSITGPEPTTIAYDSTGNISSKWGLSYTYHATKKHQVTAVGSSTYTYDANGNMNSRAGSAISWYSYNLPNTISGTGGNSSQFFYAPDRSRWKQTASYAGTSEQTIYIGGLVEKVTLGGVTQWKHYIAGSTGVVAEYVRYSSGLNDIFYLLRDHLGSTETITNYSGTKLAGLSVDAWGRRRNGGTWAGNPTAGEWTTITNTTRHGFTSHEMLDNLNLTHMNGRVYDQVIGRFLSADPIIDGPGSTQGWNRHAYVHNSPLIFIDPNGFNTKERGHISRINIIEEVVVDGRREWSTEWNPAAALYSPDVQFAAPDGMSGGGGGSHGDVIEEVVTTATRIRPGAASSAPAADSKEHQPSCNRLVRYGNALANASQLGGTISAYAIEGGAGLGALGLVTAQPELAGAGGALMETGGILGITSGGLQLTSGLLQGFGSGDYSNATNAAASLGVGFALRTSLVGLPFIDRGYRTVSQRAADAFAQNTNTVAGGTYDLVVNAIEQMGPHEVPCSSGQ